MCHTITKILRNKKDLINKMNKKQTSKKKKKMSIINLFYLIQRSDFGTHSLAYFMAQQGAANKENSFYYYTCYTSKRKIVQKTLQC